MSQAKNIGGVTWFDLTVPDADGIRDFYHQVVGWDPEDVSMGDYNDYNMKSPETGDPVTGICHQRGVNADLPSQWLIYISVEDLDASLQSVSKLGGRLVSGPRQMGEKIRYAVIEDPAGAACALIEGSG